MLFFLTLIFSLNLFAQNNFTIDPKTSKAIPNFAGQVVLSRGEVLKLVQDSTSGDHIAKTLRIGGLVNQDDVIRVGVRSIAKIRMADDSLITIGPKSQVKIDQFEFHTKKKRNMVFNLIQGQIRCYVLHKVNKKFKVAIRSKIASLGVRGTEILVNHLVGEDHKFHTEFALLSGQGIIESKKLKNKIKILAGEHIILGESDKVVRGKLSPTLFAKLTSSDSYSDKKFPELLDPFFIKATTSHKSNKIDSTIRKVTNPIKIDSGSWKEKLYKLNKLLNKQGY